MSGRGTRWTAVLAAVARGWGSPSAAEAQPTFPKPARYEPTADERARIEDRTEALARAIAAIPEGTVRDALADVAVYHKAAAWALRLGDFYDTKDVAATLKVLDRGLERARQLADGQRPWADGPGLGRPAATSRRSTARSSRSP